MIIRRHLLPLFGLILLIFCASPLVAQESTLLDQAYMDQYTHYNTEIKKLRSWIELSDRGIDRNNESISRFEKLPGTRSDISSFHQNNKEIVARLAAYQDRLTDIQERKQDLKIRLLERNKSLPTWWTE